MTAPLLAIHDLQVSFFTDKGEVRAVRGIDLAIEPGQTLALVGESGCGKSATALSIMRLIESPGRIVHGSLVYRGQDLARLPEPALRAIRGKSIGMIFQEPMTSLNPVFSIGNQIGEVLRLHQGLSERAAKHEVLRLLETVGIPSPAQRFGQYPHELSGGMKQRVMIAIALACRPDLLIADEPTTALDVTVQAQILELLKRLQDEIGMAILLITHNLGVVAQFAQVVAVMYAGKIIERAPVRALFHNPVHPYTQALLQALPQRHSVSSGREEGDTMCPRRGRRAGRLAAITGTVPSPLSYPRGCAFAARCPAVLDDCPSQQPQMTSVGPAHETACWLHNKE